MQKQVLELDGVRGIACLGVLLAHCIVGPYEPPAAGRAELAEFLLAVRAAIIPHLLGGVDLFFVLSGFLIGGILIDNRKSPNYFKAFWARRAARILPVAWALAASYALARGLHAVFDFPAWDLWLLKEPLPPVLAYATFTQNFFIAAGGVEQPRWIAITWSLAIEEQFYLLFPFAVYFLRNRSVALMSVIAIFVAMLLRRPIEELYGNWYAPYIMLVTRMDALLMGVLVTIVVRTPKALAAARRVRRALDAMMILIAVLLAANHPSLAFWPLHSGPDPVTSGPFPPLKNTLFALMHALFILRIFLYDRSLVSGALRNGVLRWFGLISYGLYMYHQAINGMMHAALFQSAPMIDSWAQLAVGVCAMALAIGFSALSFRYFETPIRNIGQKVAYWPRPAQPATAPAALAE